MKKSLASTWMLPAVAAFLVGCHDSTGGSPFSGSAQSAGTAPTASDATSRNATLSWDAPTANTNGTALTDLSGYRIYYGLDPKQFSQTVQITSVGIQTYVIENLGAGTWYFAVRAVTSAGTESSLSDVVTKVIS